MKLKDESKLKGYDELSSSYEFDFENVSIGKVTSRMFPILLNKSFWNGLGYAVLDRCKLLEKEDIDPFYMVRGEIAEIMAESYLANFYSQHGIEIVTKRFTPESVGYDMFKKNEKFSGVVDIGISAPEERRAVVEVKSKNEKDYERIVVERKYDETEVLQGKFLTRMSKVEKCMMCWVFFNNHHEEAIKLQMEILKTKNAEKIIKELNLNFTQFQYHIEAYKVDYDEMDELMNKAYENLHRNVSSSKIHRSFFTETEQQYLDKLLNYETNVEIDEDSLPF